MDNRIKRAKKNMNVRTETGAENPYVRARKQRALVILGVFSVIAAVFLFQIIHAHLSRNTINKNVAIETAQYAKLKDEHADLEDKVKQMNDDDYLEKLIRSKYLYTKKGEMVYNLPTDAD